MRKSSYPHPTNSMPVEYQVSSKTYSCSQCATEGQTCTLCRYTARNDYASTQEILRQAEKIRRMREELARELAELDRKEKAA